jgi:5-hydroxyisourate hydrolase-like protein (transthyretin family)
MVGRLLSGLAELARDDWLLAAVSGRKSLATRVQHILDGPRTSPATGGLWTAFAVVAASLCAVGLALAQAPPEDARRGRSGGAPAPSPPLRTIRGTVTSQAGEPVANATVYWYAYPKPRLSYAVEPPIMPRGHVRKPAEREELVARLATDAAGRFESSAELDPGRYYPGSWLVVLAKGAGLLTRYVKPGQAEVSLKLQPEVVIEGRLLTPGGTPAPGVRVSLMSLYGPSSAEVEFLGLTESDGELPAYWPQPQTTAAAGRFTLPSVPASSYARLTMSHPKYAVDEVIVETSPGRPRPPHMKWLESATVPPTFTHTLEPARPVQGRVTDKDTGKPLAGMLVEMAPFRNHSTQTFRTRTGADGRYRVSGHVADQYATTVYPPPDSGYIAIAVRRPWPAGAKTLDVDFALPRGKLIRGRVVHAETGELIVGAVVVYEPGRGNPNDLRGYELNNPTLADKQGRFAVTGLAGSGFLLVEAPMLDAIRVKLVPGKNEKYAMHSHGFARLEVPERGDVAPVEIAVRRGVKLEARIVGPDGTQVSDFAAYCNDTYGQLNRSQHQGVDFEGDLFFINGADPEKTYRVMFTEGTRGLGAFATLKADPARKQPQEVRLRPLAGVHGKLVGPAGLPVTAGQVYAMMVVTGKEGPFDRQELHLNAEIYSNLLPGLTRSELKESLDAKGKFALGMLMPGARLYLTATTGDRSATVPIPELTPGEDRDLGTITLQSEQR